MIELFLLFPGTYEEVMERDFIALPMATTQDIRVRADLL
jgi:hypothetical protein